MNKNIKIKIHIAASTKIWPACTEEKLGYPKSEILRTFQKFFFLCNYTARSSHNDPQRPTLWNPNHRRTCIGRAGTLDQLVCLSMRSATPARPRRRLRRRCGWPRALAHTSPCADASSHACRCVVGGRRVPWPPVYDVGRRVPWSLPDPRACPPVCRVKKCW
jgi:hypothetical protein